MPINYLDNVNVTGTLSATSDISTRSRFISGGQDVYNVISQTACNVSVYCLAPGAGNSILPNASTANTVSGNFATVVNGTSNTSNGCFTTIIGGAFNTATLSGSVVVSGCTNTASGYASSIINGIQNQALSGYTTVINGQSNTASGYHSFIAGGSANDTRGFTNTFILGTALSATQANYTYVNNLSSKNYINTLVLSTSSLQVASVSSTTAPVGTVTAKMPIYNASGIFIGYIPIYTS
jgi:hypothetical protein